MTSPFELRLLYKQADVEATLRQAESALRQAESARRKTLEGHIKALERHSQQLKKTTDKSVKGMNDSQAEVAEARAEVAKHKLMAEQASLQASNMAETMNNQVNMSPLVPPAAQTPYGGMLGGPATNQQQPTQPTQAQPAAMQPMVNTATPAM